MRKISAIIVADVLVVFQASIGFSDAAQKGDSKAGTLVFYSDGGKDILLKADKSVELDKIKAGDKVENIRGEQPGEEHKTRTCQLVSQGFLKKSSLFSYHRFYRHEPNDFFAVHW